MLVASVNMHIITQEYSLAYKLSIYVYLSRLVALCYLRVFAVALVVCEYTYVRHSTCFNTR